jgi:hypothetical protein
LAACAPAPPSPTIAPARTLAPTLAPSPAPTPLPSPTPTATPIPPLALTIRWPERVSALQPVTVEVALVLPPGVNAAAAVRAAVVDPGGAAYGVFNLLPRGEDLYAADEPLRFPLEPLEGDWRLVVDVWSALDVEGERELIFQPAPIHFRDLTGILPAGVSMRVPQAFVEVASRGDQVAGARVWRYEGGEVALWWAPGPGEPLLLNNALVMLEATHGEDTPVVLDAEETEWQGQTAFLFRESWPGTEGDPGEAFVVQGGDHWLYVLRLRTVGNEAVPPLLRQVWETFAFIEE